MSVSMTAKQKLSELRRRSPYAGLLWALRGASRRSYGWLNRQLMVEAGKYFDASGGRYHFDGMSFVLPKTLTSLYFRGFSALSGYESDEEFAYVDTYVTPDSKVLELGGCLGVMSCYVNRRLKTPVQHVVVEANPDVIPYLEQNRAANGAHFTVISGMLALQDNMPFYLHDLILAGSNKSVSTKQITVRGIRAADLIAEWGDFDTLIIDIEGGELGLLREQPELFRQCHTLLIEVHNFLNILTPFEACEVENRLHALGLRKVTNSGGNLYQVWQRE